MYLPEAREGITHLRTVADAVIIRIGIKAVGQPVAVGITGSVFAVGHAVVIGIGIERIGHNMPASVNLSAKRLYCFVL